MLELGKFDQCEGKDVSNYTYIDQNTLSSTCSPESGQFGSDYLISCSNNNGNKTVITLTNLSASRYNAGAYYQFEVLFLAQGGNLAGKYLYVKDIGLQEAYLKKCSSVLGYSYVSTKSLVLLIADKLDLNIFLSPGGAYEPFKKSASTICQGSAIIV